MYWIACKDQMPRHNQEVLTNFCNTHSLLYWDEEYEVWLHYCDDEFEANKHEVTHWLPLPELPER